MSLAMIGLSHQTAPVDVRERLAFTAPGVLHEALSFFRETLAASGMECVLLSTCNRTELYLNAPDDFSGDEMAALLLRARGFSESELPQWRTYLEERRCHAVALHLFRVASGLESMILGEGDIVRQVKSAYAAAVDAGVTGPVLNPLFHESLRVAKRARTETGLARGAFSVGHAAAEMAGSIFGSLKGHSVMLLGAGKMSETTARHLAASGASSVLVANRTYDRAVRLAEALGGRAIRYDEFAEHLTRTDIVISSTAAPRPVVTKAMVEAVLKSRRHRPLFLIDIAVPRDIETEVGDLDDVYLYNIDDLRAVVDTYQAERRQQAARAEEITEAEAAAFSRRLRTTQTAAPIVTSLRARHREIVEDELSRLRQRLSHLSPEEWRAIEMFALSVENKIAHNPTLKIREYAETQDAESAEAKMATVRELFGLERHSSRVNDEETL